MLLSPGKAGMETRRIIKAAELIHLDPFPDDADKAFMARDLVQVTLPHSNPGDVPVWGRSNGNLSLTIKPDWVLDPATGQSRCIGLPYGTIPRLLLFWITTEAIRNHFQSPRTVVIWRCGRHGDVYRHFTGWEHRFRARWQSVSFGGFDEIGHLAIVNGPILV